MAVRDWTDDDLMAALADAVGSVPPVPEHRRTAASGALAWRSVDAELMQLTHDSLLEESLVRSSGEPRVLSFTGSSYSLEVEVDDGQVMGQLLPAVPASVTVSSASGEMLAAEADDNGFFTVGGLEGGTVRFSVALGGSVCTTEWVTL